MTQHTAAGVRTAMRGPVVLTAHQVRYDLLAFARNSQARFFTLAMPVTFLLIFASVFRDKTVPVPGGVIHTSVYYVPGIIALGVIQAAVSNLAISVIAQRENGVLKRRRATPVSAGVLIGSRALTAVAVSLVLTVVLAAIGWFVYSAHIPASHLAALAVTVLVGAASFGAIGFALTTVIRGADSAQPATAALTLPLVLHLRDLPYHCLAANLAASRGWRVPGTPLPASLARRLQPLLPW
jgi:ABC-2 type transport system permease protein